MPSTYHKLKETIDDFICGVGLLTFGNCYSMDGPEVQKLAAITSFKLSVLLHTTKDHVNCLIFENIIQAIRAEGKIIDIKLIKSDPYDCIIELEPSIFSIKKTQLVCGIYHWSKAEIDIVLENLKTTGVFDPCV